MICKKGKMSLLIQVAATLPTEGPGKWRCVQSVLGGCHSWWDLDVAKVGVSLLLSAIHLYAHLFTQSKMTLKGTFYSAARTEKG